MKHSHYFILLALLMSMVASVASAKSYDTSQVDIEGIYYDLDQQNNTAMVVAVPIGLQKYSGNKAIPSSVTYNGTTYSVTSIGELAFNECTGLTSVTIPQSVTEIGRYAFSGCTGLTSIEIPEGVTSIGGGTFYECTGLTSITIPNSVTSIDENTFSGCTGLTSIELSNSVTSIGSQAFYGCTALISLTIPNSVTSIGDNELSVFENCTGLTSIIVEDGNSIYDSRDNCNAIIETATNSIVLGCKNTIIPNSVTSIGSYAFPGCTGLTSINIPESVTSIGGGAFINCIGLTSIEIPESVTSIDYSAFFGCTGLTSVTIGSGVTSIGSSAFRNCTGLTSIELTNSVTSIGDYAFSGCTGLNSIIVEAGNPKYDSRDNCNAIIETATNTLMYGCQNTIIPNSVTSIGDFAFRGCTSLTSIEIPNSVTSIGGYAFSSCTGLTTATIGNSVISIGDYAFSGCTGLTSIEIPNSVTSIGGGTFYECTGLTTATIGNSVISIGRSAFRNCTGLTSIELSNSVKSIGDYAFNGCTGLTSIELSNSVTNIGASAFNGCSGLTSVTIGSGVTSIGKAAFESCTALSLVSIPESVTSIGDYAFYNCSSLTSVTIGSGVTSIGNYVFYYCTCLKSVTSLILNPFTIPSNAFSSATYNEVTLYVPYGVLEQYKATASWNRFQNIEGINIASSLTIVVTDDNGSDITDKVNITWSDVDGKVIGAGKSISGILEDTELYYSVTLGEELGRMYREVIMRKIVYNDDEQQSCQLERIRELTLHGKVVSGGTDLSDVDVNLIQWLNGKYEYKNMTKTDESGEFQLTAYVDSTELTFSANGYVDKKMVRSQLYSTDLGVINMEEAQGIIVALELNYQEAAPEGQEPVTTTGYSDTRNITYIVHNVTKNEDIENLEMQYGNLILPAGSEPGDSIAVTLRSLNGKFAPAIGGGTISADGTAKIPVQLVAYGGVEAVISEMNDDQLLVMLYDSEGKLATSTITTGKRVTFTDLESGRYTLVAMGYNGTVGAIGDLSSLYALGLVDGSDYITAITDVRDGIIGNIVIGVVPELDASKFEYTAQNTSYLPNKSLMTVDGLSFVTLTARVDFKTQYVDNVDNVKMIVDIPEGCEFILNSVVSGTKALPHTVNGSQLTITLDKKDIDSRIRFCMRPKQPGVFSSTAYTLFDCSGERQQTIGASVFEATAGSIAVPSQTATKQITVCGVAAPHANVNIYDGEQLIGTTIALGDGNWRTDVELYMAYNLSIHEIYAKYETDNGIKATTDAQTCVYDNTEIKAKTVTMSFYNAWLSKNVEVTFDFKDYKTSSSNYQFYTATNFTFVADLTANDTINVKGVTFYVYTTTKEVRKLKGFFDDKLGRWVAVSYFDSNNMPVNLDVEAEPAQMNNLGDREQLTDALAEDRKSFEDAKAEMAEIDESFDLENIDMSSSISNRMQALLDNENCTKADVKAFFDELSLETLYDGDVDSTQLAQEYAQLMAEADELIATYNKDYIYSALHLNVGLLDMDWPSSPFSATNSGNDGEYKIVIEKLTSINEGELLALGYQFNYLTDGTKVYYLLSDSEIVFIDGGTLEKYSYTFADSSKFLMSAKRRSIKIDPGLPYAASLNMAFTLLEYARNMDVSSSDKLNAKIEVIDRALTSLSEAYSGFRDWSIRSISTLISAQLSYLDGKCVALETLLQKYRKLISAQEALYEALPISIIRGKVDELLNIFNKIEKSIAKIKKLHWQTTLLYDKIINIIEESLPKKLTQKYNINLSKLKTPKDMLSKMSVGGKLLGGLGVGFEMIGFWDDLWDYNENLKSWRNLQFAIEKLLPCPKSHEQALNLQKEIISTTKDMNATWLRILTAEGGAIVVDIASLCVEMVPQAALAAWLGSSGLNIYAEWSKFLNMNGHSAKFLNKLVEYSMALGRLDCREEGDDGNDDNDNDNGAGNGNRIGKVFIPCPLFTPIVPIHDPSGFVYEAVPTNRVEGVTASIYYEDEGPQLWDAADFSQVNPQKTDETGLYQWDVPQGMWQVRFEKSGYETTQTEWLPVPPPQLEINIPMKHAIAPRVVKTRGMESGITLDFSKYMKPAEMEKNGRVTATVNGKTANGNTEMLNLEKDPYTGKEYASKVKFVPTTSFKTSDEVVITVKKEVESYADKQMDEDFIATVKIESEINGLQCDSIIALDYQSDYELEITATPVAAVRGRTLSIATTSSMIATTDRQNVTFNEEGKANITVSGNLPGCASLHLQIDGTDIEKYVEVNVVLHETVVRTPKASKRSGSKIEEGYLLWLTSNTPGATIFYTLDGSCPCDETARTKYTGPFVLPVGEVTVKAIAMRQGMEDSDVATFKYTVEKAVDGISETKTDLHVETELSRGVLTISGAEGCIVRVYDMAGRELTSRHNIKGKVSLNVPLVDSYIVSITNSEGHTMVQKIASR